MKKYILFITVACSSLLLCTNISANNENTTKRKYIKVTPCKYHSKADTHVIAEIKRATNDIWNKGWIDSIDSELTEWAKINFENVEDFTQFLLNWANVETGGNFNANHENWSKNGTEQNLGILQINQTWATLHNTWKWHDSNPHNFTAKNAFDPYKCVDWALHHLLGMGKEAKWNLTKMLDSYWHGTFNDPSPYAEGIYNGHIIDYPM